MHSRRLRGRVRTNAARGVRSTRADPERLTIAQHLRDLDAVVDHLERNLGRKKIVLIGHSWGGALGLLYIQAHPGKVTAFVGVAPMLSTVAQQQAQYDFVTTEASRRDDRDAIATALIGPPHAMWRDRLAMERLVDKYGGLYHNRPIKPG
jgi:pimeloyl-ACP methyl ester carboxylesterase